MTPTTSVFGYPWPDARQLTVSFVPDGTPLGIGSARVSTLFADMSQDLPPPIWQAEVLRALQTWASESNIDLVLVPEVGITPLGVPGPTQGDPRFGDIRIAGGLLSSGTVAVSVPYSPLAGTWAGDLIFNTAQFNFQGRLPGTDSFVGPPDGYDVYTVALHEGGHIFGIPGVMDPTTSPMFEYYTVPQMGLGIDEVTSLQALYGLRQPDAFEGLTGNDTLETAFVLNRAARKTFRSELRTAGEDATGDQADVLTVLADVGTRTDVDLYSFRINSLTPGMTIRLQTADLSLLRGQVSVLNAAGHVVAVAVGDPMSPFPQGQLMLRLDAGVLPVGDYFLRVEGAPLADAFAVGRYRLVVEPDAPTATTIRQGEIYATFLETLTGDDTLLDANPLLVLPGSGHSFVGQGRIGSAQDIDYHRLKLPEDSTTLSVMLAGAGQLSLTVLDNKGQVVATRDGAGLVTLDLTGLKAGRRYYLAVTGAEGTRYRLAAQASVPVLEPGVVSTGTLTDTTVQVNRGVTMPESGVLHLDVSLSAPGATVETAVEVALFNQAGQMVFRQVIFVGQADLSLSLFLSAGSYTLRLVGGTLDDSPMADVELTIRSLLMSDPIGPRLIDPTQPAPPRNITPLWVDTGFLPVVALVDPYGRPLPIGGGADNNTDDDPVVEGDAEEEEVGQEEESEDTPEPEVGEDESSGAL